MKYFGSAATDCSMSFYVTGKGVLKAKISGLADETPGHNPKSAMCDSVGFIQPCH